MEKGKLWPPPPLNPLSDSYQNLRRSLHHGYLPPCKIFFRLDKGFRFRGCSTSHTIVYSATLFYSMLQYTHCKRCISYGNSVCPSVCLSITSQYCVKTTACSTMQFVLSDSKTCTNQKIFPGDDPFPLKFWLQVTYYLNNQSSLPRCRLLSLRGRLSDLLPFKTSTL